MLNANWGCLRYYYVFPGDVKAAYNDNNSIEVASALHEGGYVVEARIPLNKFPGMDKLAAGSSFGFAVSLVHIDPDAGWCHMWTPGFAYGKVTLSEGEVSERIPADEFMWGFVQVFSSQPCPVTDEEFERIIHDMHINAMRFFVSPSLLGLPQRTWNGPEAIDYTKLPEEAWHWGFLDQTLEQLKKFNVRPVILMLPVHEYTEGIFRDDLNEIKAFNDAAKSQDYTGINPLEQMKYFSAKVAKHIYDKIGPNFSVLFDELCGADQAGPFERQARNEQGKWAEVVKSIKDVAPGVEVFSPELCVGMWWFPTCRRWGGGSNIKGKPIGYETYWPRGDKIEDYASVFDSVSVSWYPDNSELGRWSPGLPYVTASAQVLTYIVRDHIVPRKWFAGEVPWAMHPNTKELMMGLATHLFGMDNCRGITLWQLKDAEGSGCGVLGTNGERSESYSFIKALSDVVADEYKFLSTYHITDNQDGFPVADEFFAENDELVLTRHLSSHLLLFNCGREQASVTLTNTNGWLLENKVYWKTPLNISRVDTGLQISGIEPGVLYVLEQVRPREP